MGRWGYEDKLPRLVASRGIASQPAQFSFELAQASLARRGQLVAQQPPQGLPFAPVSVNDDVERRTGLVILMEW